ncbi:PIG-L family deacetylase [Streptomyces sp. NBC_00441]|uniref:PIG-L deacetylase family protein n=1 Tax=Streptomyces sp. NBC_00441 TaxID=2975742 RepID=UPI002E2B1DB2|nr:PIG-L family deacetylase [Streptomyces sp. NBC_00441]
MDARCALFVSPHWDDAVMSAGGLLAVRAGAACEDALLTVFAQVPVPPFSGFSRGFHTACGLGDDIGERRAAEDRSAAAVLGVRLLQGDVLDAIYRRGPSGGWLYDGEGRTFEPRAADDDVFPRVRGVVAAAVRERTPDLMLAPFGIGGHVDHLLVRAAVVSVGREQDIPVLLWEDQPYALRHRVPGAPGGVDVAIGEEAWARKIEATAAYASQLRMLFEPGEDWAAEFDRHARRLGGTEEHVERYWPADPDTLPR